MKKFTKIFTTLLLSVLMAFSVGSFYACGNDKVIKVCASETPHAEVLNGIVKDLLKEKGYTLKVKVLDWTMQNDAVSKGDYDANYFQHVPYLEQYEGTPKLFAVCKVHYEPLGIYYGKEESVGTSVTDGKTFEICDDESNAARAFRLLEAKGVISQEVEGDNFPVKDDDSLNLGETSTKWTSNDGNIIVTLVAENLLVSSMKDFDFALLPCNTAYTGNISSDRRAAVEDDPVQVAGKANVIAARVYDYKNNEA